MRPLHAVRHAWNHIAYYRRAVLVSTRCDSWPRGGVGEAGEGQRGERGGERTQRPPAEAQTRC